MEEERTYETEITEVPLQYNSERNNMPYRDTKVNPLDSIWKAITNGYSTLCDKYTEDLTEMHKHLHEYYKIITNFSDMHPKYDYLPEKFDPIQLLESLNMMLPNLATSSESEEEYGGAEHSEDDDSNDDYIGEAMDEDIRKMYDTRMHEYMMDRAIYSRKTDAESELYMEKSYNELEKFVARYPDLDLPRPLKPAHIIINKLLS